MWQDFLHLSMSMYVSACVTHTPSGRTASKNGVTASKNGQFCMLLPLAPTMLQNLEDLLCASRVSAESECSFIKNCLLCYFVSECVCVGVYVCCERRRQRGACISCHEHLFPLTVIVTLSVRLTSCSVYRSEMSMKWCVFLLKDLGVDCMPAIRCQVRESE